MAFNSRTHFIEGKNYRFSSGDMYEQNGKTWIEVDHVYKEKYKRIADKILEVEPYNG